MSSAMADRSEGAAETSGGAPVVVLPTSTKRHHWIVRVTHWVNAIALVLMIGSGLRIFNAYPKFARRGERFCCYPFEGKPIPDRLRNQCDGNWKRKHQGLSICRGGFGSASMPFNGNAGSLQFSAEPEARVEVQ